LTLEMSKLTLLEPTEAIRIAVCPYYFPSVSNEQIDRVQWISEQITVGPTTVAEMIGQYLAIPPKLHKRLSQQPVPGLPEKWTLLVIVQVIGKACTAVSMATFITDSLFLHVYSRSMNLTALRANPLYLFSDDEKVYPVIEWSESDKSDKSTNIAIFHFEHQNKQCKQCSPSWLIHSFVTTAEDHEKSRLSWSVSHISHISLLFTLVQHLFGILQWNEEDILNVYCDRNFDCELPEYFPVSRNCANQIE